MAEDYGGPRKEFFRLVLAQIKETFFDRGLREMLREKYVAVGIVLGNFEKKYYSQYMNIEKSI